MSFEAKLFFAGDFDRSVISKTINSLSSEKITATFDKNHPALSNYDFIFIADKSLSSLEVISPTFPLTLKIDVKRSSVNNAAVILLNSLYGKIYIGMDWYDIYSALSGGEKPIKYIGNLSESDLLALKKEFKNASGAFLYICLPVNSTLEYSNKLSQDFSNILNNEAALIWTITFDDKLTQAVGNVFIRE